jgi:hypothetical protein
MPLNGPAGKLVVSTRTQEVARYVRDYGIRNPGARTDAGSFPYIDAQVYADVTTLHRSNSVTTANGISRANMTGDQLDAEATRLGTFRLPPVGGGGFIVIGTSSAGATIVTGDLLSGPSNTRYQALQTGVFGNGALIALIGVSVGPSTNLDAGTVLRWTSPRLGLNPTATVAIQANGAGLTGGNNLETDDQLRARLDYIAANPSASGNDAHYQSVLMQTPGVAVQQAFTVPCYAGPGTIAWSITIRPPQPGASRIPNSAQLALAAAYLQGTSSVPGASLGSMPVDDSAAGCTIVASPVTLGLQVVWAPTAAGWADASPFPTFQGADGGGNFNWEVSSGTSPITPTSFSIQSVETSVTPAVPPAGASIALFDLTELAFHRKVILSAVSDGSGGFTITVDQSSGLSDTSYVPVVGQKLSPWSDSLDGVVPAVTPYFDTLGPGEQFASFPDPGQRQRRSPASPQYWPSAITTKLLGGAVTPQPPQGPQQNQPAVLTLLSLPSLADVLIVEPSPLPSPAPVGTPGVSFQLQTLGDIVLYPE